MTDDIAERVLSEDAATDGDKEDGEYPKLKQMEWLGVVCTIAAAALWGIIGVLSGWATTGIFGYSAQTLTLTAVGLLVGLGVVHFLPVEDEAKGSILLVVILLGFGILATGIVFGADVLGASLAAAILTGGGG